MKPMRVRMKKGLLVFALALGLLGLPASARAICEQGGSGYLGCVAVVSECWVTVSCELFRCSGHESTGINTGPIEVFICE